ncbi:hypothetical protein Pcinc_014812 [Petrolisthes cinctipes]|uniref:Uncharacterized protein n=1 Tax=Petrolisthes cinctipes TaxID=88211 RepID=A0AAE1KSW3_PETCI|nr:hypothetical protein Pcinc_014812 [Petrolisthes cinctipes]
MPLKHPIKIFLIFLSYYLATAHGHQECLVSQNIRLPWLWPRANLQTWVDPSMFSQPMPVFQFNITFWGGTADQFHFVRVTTNETIVTPANSASPTHEVIHQRELSVGWLNVSLDISHNLTLTKRDPNDGEDQVLISYPIQHSVMNIAFSGSNITVNCSSGKLIWRIGGRGISHTVPIPPVLRPIHLSIYPYRPLLPTLRLTGGRAITLGLINGQPTTAITIITNHNITTTAQPLTSFTHWDLIINFTSVDDGVLCEFRMSKKVLETATLPFHPMALEVSVWEGQSGFPFLLLQDTNQPILDPNSGGSSDVITPPSTSKTITTTVPTSHNSNITDGWSGWWVFVATTLAILLIFVVIMCVISHYHRPVIEKYFPGIPGLQQLMGDEEADGDTESSEQPDRRPLLGRSISLINTANTKATAAMRLWNAVASGAESEVEQVLETLSLDPTVSVAGLGTSPYQEAHRRGHVKVLRVLEVFMHRRPNTPHNDMILGVMQAHNKKVEEVFASAQGGQYRHHGGVDVLLRGYSLPGTLQDSQGCSLLHYAASMALADSGPLWLADDIRSLVQTHGVYVNAVDFEGQTALHTLSQKASVSEQHTFWDGRTLSVCQAWMALADLLMTLGANPSLPDHSNKYPSHLAQDVDNQQLADLFVKAESEKPETQADCPLTRSQQLMEAAGEGNVKAITALLTAGAGTVVPIGSQCDPLLAAVKNGHRDAAFLLLAAGAPLCAHGLLGNTPFQAAHATLGLPALFPAIIRKAFCDRLETEAEPLSGEDTVEVVLREGLGYLRDIAELSGHRLGEELGKWLDQHPPSGSTSYMDMLAQAASHGLTLTCQLLGVAGVHLNPLPHEPHPLACALNNERYHTAYSLCRDLKMKPHTLPTTPPNLPPLLFHHLVTSELQKFEDKLAKKEVEQRASQDLLECARGKRTSRNIKQQTAFLYLLAELDLVTLLHQARETQDNLDINYVVHQPSGATMLHVAAAYGKMGMVEYLLRCNADHTRHTHSGLAPVHLAAIKGHRDCVKYILKYTGAELGCSLGLTPTLMLQHFSANVHSRHLDLLTYRQKAAVAAAKGHHARAGLILADYLGKLGITSAAAFWDELVAEECNMEAFNTQELETSIQKDIQLLCDQISQVDIRFVGKLVSCSPVKEKIELLLPETFDFCLELEAYSSLNNGCITINKYKKDVQSREQITGINSTKDQDLFSGTNFKTFFSKAVHEALSATKFSFLAIIPPFLGHTVTGVSIHAAYRTKQRVSLVRVSLSPVIKAPRPQWLNKKLLGQLINGPESIEVHEHLANMSEGMWVYQYNPAMRCILSRASETERRVAQACLYLRKLLETCWWLPKEQQRKQGQAWEIHPTGVAFPDINTFLTHFLLVVVEGEPERNTRWTQGQFMEKVVVVLKNCMSGPSNHDSPEYVLLTTQQEAKINDALQATVQFLLDLQNHSTENGKTNGRANVENT